MERLIENFNKLSNLPFARLIALMVGMSLSIAVGVGVVLWSTEEDYTVLFADISAEEASEVISSLDSLSVPYRIDSRTGMISVPAEKKHEIRLKLASEGLPSKRGGNGFSILYEEQQLGTSSFMERARFNRALEEELAASIATLDGVRSARVHLAIPKHTSFIKNRAKANASVLIELIPGRVLNDNQMAGIVYLIASSVPGLEPEKVTLVDQKGQLLSNQSSDSDMMGNEQMRLTQAMEEKLASSIVDILSPILGEDRVKARVSADMNFTSTERTVEQYSPDSLSLRSEQTVNESGMSVSAVGAPGTAVEVVDEDQAELPPPVDTRTVRATRNYEIDHSVSYIKERAGTLSRISVAVVVDYNNTVLDDGTIERTPLTPDEMQEIERLVREAVGFNEIRGDSISVTTVPFVEVTRELAEIQEVPLWQQAWVQTLVKQVLGFIGLLILMLAVVRPLLKTMVAAAEKHSATRQPVLSMPEGGVVATQPYEQQFQMPDYSRQLQGARTLAAEDPTQVAQVIRNWVAADG